MKRGTDRILTTFAGSLIRPPEVRALPPDADESTRTAVLRTAVADVVRKQVEVGVDIVSDGEFGKSGWHNYANSELDALGLRSVA
jgi:5-methyltetrahydropteroyltriglutamate--homocysteine methyltransferase